MYPLEALKKLTYPRGAGGREYQIGQIFNALSERDQKFYLLAKAAKLPDAPVSKPYSAPREAKAMTAEPEKQPEPMMFQGTPEQEPEPPRTRRYVRRDMEAEGS